MTSAEEKAIHAALARPFDEHGIQGTEGGSLAVATTPPESAIGTPPTD